MKKIFKIIFSLVLIALIAVGAVFVWNKYQKHKEAQEWARGRESANDRYMARLAQEQAEQIKREANQKATLEKEAKDREEEAKEAEEIKKEEEQYAEIDIPDEKIFKKFNYLAMGAPEDFVIPEGYQKIDEKALSLLPNLKSVTIPDSVIAIGYSIFFGSFHIESVYISTNCGIYKRVKSYCKGDVTINGESAIIKPDNGYRKDMDYSSGFWDYGDQYESEEKQEDLQKKHSNIFTSADYKAMGSPTDLVIPEGCTAIDCNAFFECDNLKSVKIPNTVTEIGDYAYARCFSLISITLPNSVTTINSRAFELCTSLTEVTIPDSVTDISDAFSWCKSLQSVTIGDSLTSISELTFYPCESLVSIYINEDSPIYEQAKATYGDIVKVKK
ncbi:MAG: leucine-rich repeat domain-containing protein [Rikenellaceae bacterium]